MTRWVLVFPDHVVRRVIPVIELKGPTGKFSYQLIFCFLTLGR